MYLFLQTTIDALTGIFEKPMTTNLRTAMLETLEKRAEKVREDEVFRPNLLVFGIDFTVELVMNLATKLPSDAEDKQILNGLIAKMLSDNAEGVEFSNEKEVNRWLAPFAAALAECDDRILEELLLKSVKENDLLTVMSLILLTDVPVRNAYDKSQFSLLHHAIVNQFYPMAEILIKAGLDVNVVDACKNTALHFACSEDLYEAVYLLLTLGADREMSNNVGQKPIDKAVFWKKEPIISLLKSLDEHMHTSEWVMRNRDKTRSNIASNYHLRHRPYSERSLVFLYKPGQKAKIPLEQADYSSGEEWLPAKEPVRRKF